MKKIIFAMLICIICLLSTGCNVYTSPKLLKTGANSISYNDESSTIDLLNNFLESDDFYRSFVFSNFYHKISYIKNKNVDFNLLLSRQDAENVLLKKYNSLSTNMSHSLRRIFLKDLLIHYYYKEFEETINSLRDVSIPVTPNGSIVNYYSMGEQLNSGDIESIRAIVETYYPTAYEVGTPTTNYNCHSYAWYSQTISNNIYSFNYPNLYIDDYSYEEAIGTPRAGDIMCYWSYGLHDTYGEEEYGYYISHSAIIQSIESGFNVTLPSTFNKINLISKWGDWGLYTHKGDGTPYTEQEADFCYAKIYRPKSNASYVLSQSNLTFDESCYANGNSSVIIDKYEMYEINVNYSHNYQMIISSIYPVSVRMYDKHMQLMIDNPDNNYSNSSYSVIINPYLANGDIYYLRVSYQNSYNTGTIITHMHNYSYDYVWINYMRHNAICSCGSVHSEMHIASGTPISPGSPYSECILCGGLVPITINAPEYGTNR